MIKRNPCRVKKKTIYRQWSRNIERRGYAQERKTFDGEEQMFVMEGGDTSIGYWYPTDEVRLNMVDGETTKEPTRKSMWTRVK